MSLKIIFITPYPFDQAPSQRFRFEQYLNVLDKNGYKYAIKPFLTQRAWRLIYTANNLLFFGYLIFGYLRRVGHFLLIPFYDYVFIHREATPLGPPIFEWLIVKIFSKKIIYDFDDTIWLFDPTERGGLLAKLKWKSKVSNICKWSQRVSVGNRFLAEYAKKYNKNVVINPTTIDTKNVHNPELAMTVIPYELEERSIHLKQDGNFERITLTIPNDDIKKPVIGWTGTHSTLQYLDKIIPVIAQLEKKYDFIFLVIANKNPQFKLKSFQYLPWQKKTEIEDLMRIDVGIMPLTNDEWSKGKCGFKLLQFMALEKPVLASPVGINVNIIVQNTNGFLCNSESDWYDKMELLINQPEKRKEFGEKGRAKVIELYSVESNQANFLSLFE